MRTIVFWLVVLLWLAMGMMMAYWPSLYRGGPLRPWFRERMAFLLGFLERGKGPAKFGPLLLVVPISELNPAHGI